MPETTHEPSSPSSPTYSSSDRASVASGYFPHGRSSSDTSHSSQPSEGNRSNPARDDSPSGDVTPSPNAPAPSTEPVASGHTKVPFVTSVRSSLTVDVPVDVRASGDEFSIRRSSTPTTAHLSRPPAPALPDRAIRPGSGPNPATAHLSRPPAPAPPKQPQSQLDLLRAHGHILPEYINALHTDVSDEMLHIASAFKKDVVRVEDKVNKQIRCLQTVEDKVDDQSLHLQSVEDIVKTVQRNQDNTQATLESILKAVSHGVPDKPRGAVDNGYVDDATFERLLVKVVERIEQRLDAASAKRLAAFKDEIAQKHSELKEEITTQIRVELGGEIALSALNTEAIKAKHHNAVVEYLAELATVVYTLRDNVSNLPVTDAVATSALPRSPSPSPAVPGVSSSPASGPIVPRLGPPQVGASVGASAPNPPAFFPSSYPAPHPPTQR